MLKIKMIKTKSVIAKQEIIILKKIIIKKKLNLDLVQNGRE